VVLRRFRRNALVLLVLVLLPSAANSAGVMLSATHPAGDHQDVAGLVHGHGHIAGTPDHEHNATFGAGIAHAAQREVAQLTTAALPPIAPEFHPRWRSSTLSPHPPPAPRFQILRI
jgi:hypothetical protein